MPKHFIMKLQTRINAFLKISEFFKNLETEKYNGTNPKLENHFEKFKMLIQNEHFKNSWFTPDNIRYAIASIANAISKDKIEIWLENYKNILETTKPQRVAVILAGNIPLVGFHDFMTVLISGNIFVGKLSSKDNNLLKAVIALLIEIEPQFNKFIYTTEGKLENFEKVIATGSNNTARYFEYYFGKYPHIIRNNRNSVAVITNEQHKEEIELLSNDIFMYYGLGCRNVSKVFFPENFNIDIFFEALYKNKDLINHHSYANNYDYNRAIYLMNIDKFLDNGVFMIKESELLSSPISVIYYEFYKDLDQLSEYLNHQKDKLQCIVSQQQIPNFETIKYSQAQQPELWHYADNINTLDFLISK